MRSWVCLIAVMATACSDRAPEPAAAPAPAEPAQAEPIEAESPATEASPPPKEIDVTRVPDAETVEQLRKKLKRPPDKTVLTVSPPPIDVTCEVASDCAVKDVGNCCGYYPRCVNVDFKPDPKAVQAQCEREGRMGVCGFAEIKSCTCEERQCVSHSASAD